MNDKLVGLGIVIAIITALGIGLSKCERSPRPPVVVEDVTSVPVEKPTDGSHVGEDPAGQPEPVVPVVSVPVEKPTDGSHVGEDPAGQPEPVVPVEVQEPKPVKKPTVHKPVTVKEVTPDKKKPYVSHEVTYPRLSVPAFYPEKHWKK